MGMEVGKGVGAKRSRDLPMLCCVAVTRTNSHAASTRLAVSSYLIASFDQVAGLLDNGSKSG